MLALTLVLRVRLHLDLALVGVEQLHLLLQLLPQSLALRFLGLVQSQLAQAQPSKPHAQRTERWRDGEGEKKEEKGKKAKENDKGSTVEKLGQTRWRTKGVREEMAGKGTVTAERVRERERWREREWERVGDRVGESDRDRETGHREETKNKTRLSNNWNLFH